MRPEHCLKSSGMRALSIKEKGRSAKRRIQAKNGSAAVMVSGKTGNLITELLQNREELSGSLAKRNDEAKIVGAFRNRH